MKKFIILFLCVPLVYSELHRFMTAYTGINGQTAAGTPEFSAVTTLDGHQIDYYDNNIKKMIPKQDWMKAFASTDMSIDYIKIREKLQQIYKNTIYVLMETFTQSQGICDEDRRACSRFIQTQPQLSSTYCKMKLEDYGVHTYQRMYGCEWDDETGDSHGFDEYGYDGEDFISLDLKENRYNAHVPQASPTVMKWNKDREQLISLKQYYNYECVYWLKEFLHLSKATSEKTDPPKVALLEKNPDYYTCHVTGFLFRNTNISWRKNGQALSDSSDLVESEATLPNEDGTFQRRVVLYVVPDEWREDQYTCVVEHKSLTEPIQKSMTVNKTKRNKSALDALYIMHLDPVIILVIIGLIVLIGLIGLFVLWKHWKKLKACYKKKIIYVKTKSSQEPASQDSLVPIPSNESTSRRKACDTEKTPYRSKSKPSPEHAPAQKPLLSTLSNESTSSTETYDSRVSSDFMFPHKDEQNPSPESSPSQFLTGGPISPTLPNN